MTDQIENDKNSQNYKELTEKEILKAKEELTNIQKNLSEKKITVDEAKKEIEKIYEIIKGTNLEQQVFEKLTKLEENVDNNTLKNEFDNIIDLLTYATKQELEGLEKDVHEHTNNKIDSIGPKNDVHEHTNNGRPTDAQEGRTGALNGLNLTINNAAEDKNRAARQIGKVMKRLNK